MNNLKNEQSKSNTNEPTLSNTYLFGQNSVNANKTLINNLINDNLIVINENNNNINNNKNTININKKEKKYENNLILEIMTSWNLPEGYNLTIKNKHGLENSLIKRSLKEKEGRNIVY